MYRPDGWDELAEIDNCSNMIPWMFEAGADAMLEGLKKNCIRKINLPANKKRINDLSDFELKQSGYLIFIPEEE